MIIKNVNMSFDIKERWWKVWLIDEIIQNKMNVDAFRENLDLIHNLNIRIA